MDSTKKRWATVQQPILFPPIYMMARFAMCHDLVVFDQAQFDRDNLQFKLLAQHGPLLRSVEVTRFEFNGQPSHRTLFKDRRLFDVARWATKTTYCAQATYGKQEAYRDLKEWFEYVVNALMIDCVTVTDFCTTALRSLFHLLDIETKVHIGSDLIPERAKDPTQALADYCSQLHTTDYVQGEKSMRDYFVKGPFESIGVTTWGQQFYCFYEHHNQVADASFSILDLLFTRGVQRAKEMLQPSPWGVVKITR